MQSQTSNEEARRKPISSIPSDLPLRGIRVLIVDDSPENRLLISHILKRGGCQVIDTAENGKLGAERAETHEYDVVLMDMQMPIMNGYDATAALRSNGYEKPILAVTAHAMAEDRIRCLEVGCDDFLVKPIETKKFFDAILRSVDSH